MVTERLCGTGAIRRLAPFASSERRTGVSAALVNGGKLDGAGARLSDYPRLRPRLPARSGSGSCARCALRRKRTFFCLVRCLRQAMRLRLFNAARASQCGWPIMDLAGVMIAAAGLASGTLPPCTPSWGYRPATVASRRPTMGLATPGGRSPSSSRCRTGTERSDAPRRSRAGGTGCCAPIRRESAPDRAGRARSACAGAG